MSTSTIESRISADAVQPLRLAASNEDAPQFFGAIRHAFAHAYMHYAQGQYGPGVITSKADLSELGNHNASRAALGDLLAIREQNLI
jgi:hypothetical protein